MNIGELWVTYDVCLYKPAVVPDALFAVQGLYGHYYINQDTATAYTGFNGAKVFGTQHARGLMVGPGNFGAPNGYYSHLYSTGNNTLPEETVFFSPGADNSTLVLVHPSFTSHTVFVVFTLLNNDAASGFTYPAGRYLIWNAGSGASLPDAAPNTFWYNNVSYSSSSGFVESSDVINAAGSYSTDTVAAWFDLEQYASPPAGWNYAHVMVLDTGGTSGIDATATYGVECVIVFVPGGASVSKKKDAVAAAERALEQKIAERNAENDLKRELLEFQEKRKRKLKKLSEGVELMDLGDTKAVDRKEVKREGKDAKGGGGFDAEPGDWDMSDSDASESESDADLSRAQLLSRLAKLDKKRAHTAKAEAGSQSRPTTPVTSQSSAGLGLGPGVQIASTAPAKTGSLK